MEKSCEELHGERHLPGMCIYLLLCASDLTGLDWRMEKRYTI